MTNPVHLEFINADTFEVIELADFGDVYRNSGNNLLSLMIVNSGGRDAVNVTAKFIGYMRDGQLDNISKDWQQLSYDDSSSFQSELQLPDIKSGKFMTGFKVYSEDFNSIITQYLPPDWEQEGKWEVYSLTEGNQFNSYLQYIADSVDISTGRVIPKQFPASVNCELQVEIATPKYNFGGVQLRVNPTTGVGYAVIIYPDPTTISQINEYYSEVIGSTYVPIDSNSQCAIGIGKVKYTDLDNMAFPNIYNKFHWLPKGNDYRLERDTLKINLTDNVFNIYINDELKGRYVDPDPIMEEGNIALIAGRRYDTRTIFDNLQYKTETSRGILFIKSVVPSNPDDSVAGDSTYYSQLLIEYSE